MLLLHPPGLCGAGLGGRVVDIHLCTRIRSPLNKAYIELSKGMEGDQLTLVGSSGFLGIVLIGCRK
jgi:hypothetical protein